MRPNLGCACNTARKGYLPKFSMPVGELFMPIRDVEVDLGRIRIRFLPVYLCVSSRAAFQLNARRRHQIIAVKAFARSIGHKLVCRSLKNCVGPLDQLNESCIFPFYITCFTRVEGALQSRSATQPQAGQCSCTKVPYHRPERLR